MDPQQPKQEDPKLEGLPVESSPYTQYKDLEDYKEKGYGTHGHQEVKTGRGAAASTDAPTATGGASLPTQSNKGSDPAAATTATDTVNKYGVS
ncbi:putative Late embryogenesis abundant protein, LEA-18 [Helianthus anomalus]